MIKLIIILQCPIVLSQVNNTVSVILSCQLLKHIMHIILSIYLYRAEIQTDQNVIHVLGVPLASFTETVYTAVRNAVTFI